MPQTNTNLLVHFIFSTKQRCALIKPDFKKDLHAYLGGIVRQIGGVALFVNGTRDHVHLLIRMPTHQIGCRGRWFNKNELLAMDPQSLARAPSLRLADRLWIIYR